LYLNGRKKLNFNSNIKIWNQSKISIKTKKAELC